MTIDHTDESKEIITKCEGLWSKIRDSVRSITKTSDDYDDKNMKINFNSYRELPLDKTIGIYNVAIAIRAIFYENNYCYLKFCLDKCLYKL